jgi:hypothetical protein
MRATTAAPAVCSAHLGGMEEGIFRVGVHSYRQRGACCAAKGVDCKGWEASRRGEKQGGRLNSVEQLSVAGP